MSELKPCPFCASENMRMETLEVGKETGHPHNEYAVVCYNCGAFGPNDLGQSGAEESWNMRRASSTPVRPADSVAETLQN